VGVSAGYAFSETDITTVGTLPGNIANVAALARPPSLSVEQEGFIGGAQVGYNVQFGAFVAGIEADISYTDLSSDVTYASPATFGTALAGTRAPSRRISSTSAPCAPASVWRSTGCWSTPPAASRSAGSRSTRTS
jgi:hypothetical protein